MIGTKHQRIIVELRAPRGTQPKCSGCGKACLGVAMLVAYLVGFGLAEVTGSTLLGFLVGAPLFLLLVLGLPAKKSAQASADDTAISSAQS
ncbi:MAG: hypothetical protein ACI9A1_001639 [Lentimonas sp.]|jgi:hypothetical protein